MKRILPLVALFSTLIFSSCWKERLPCKIERSDTSSVTRILSDTFKAISIQLDCNVFITKGATPSVTISGPSNILDFIEVKKRLDTIETIYARRCFNGDKPITIHFTVQNFHYLEMIGSGNVTVEDTFNTELCDINLRGPGNVIYRGNATQMRAHNFSSGNIYLYGTSTTQKLIVENLGNIEAFGQPADTSEIEILNAGDGKVNPLQHMIVQTFSKGDVYYKNNPTISWLHKGTGTLIKVD